MSKKKPGKKHPNSLYKLYAKSGDKLQHKGKECPKCGNGIFLAQHKDRKHCGKCGYMERSKLQKA